MRAWRHVRSARNGSALRSGEEVRWPPPLCGYIRRMHSAQSASAFSALARIWSALWRIALPWYLVTTVGRAALWGWQQGRLEDLASGERWMAFVHGWRMDTIAMSWMLVPVVALLCLAPAREGSPVAKIVRGYSLCMLLTIVFVEVATFPFFAEYDVRPNFLFTAYLEYPAEMFGMIWKEQKLGLAVSAGCIGAALWHFTRRNRLPQAESVLEVRWVARAVWLLPFAAILFAGIRSSLGHRPANNSDALYCQNRVAGEIAKNSVYSVLYEAYRGRKDGQRLAKQYSPMSMEEAYRRVQELQRIPTDGKRPLHHTIAPVVPAQKPRNLVIVIQEGMGSRFVGHLGDKRGLTPHLDALATESLTFHELYSNGTRSIRGLDALSAGFLAIPGDGVLKRPKSQSNFFTVASLLEPLGYHSSFLYGGEARFDNMLGWYSGNGFDLIVEERDFPNPSFRGNWGVGDEDLFRRAHELYLSLHEQKKPFVSVVFTTSNHTPFDLPKGRFPLVDGVPEASVENAIRYADYSMHVFFELAKKSPYYDDTVFLVAADHDARVYGDDVVPVHAFHIPGLVHGKVVPPRQHMGLAAQPDLLATALSYVGIPLETPIFGTPIDRPGRNEWALMQFNEAYGFRRGDKVAVLRPNMPPETWSYVNSRLVPASPDLDLQATGAALLHVVEDVYERSTYR